MEVFGIIYLLIDGTNDKEYVGQTTQTLEERFKEHCWCKTSNIGKAIRKRGKDMFIKVILKVCYSQDELNYWERHFIKSRGTRWPFGYNNSEGGEGGWERTPESIEKMSRKGQKPSDETRIQISLNSVGKPGRPLTEEEKAHLSEVAPNKRRVICVETEEVYDSVSAAARFHNVSVQTIYHACKCSWRIAAGFHWKFADTPDESTEETTSTKSRKKRRVVCVETGEEFEGILAAARFYKVDRKSIAKACKNPEKVSAGHHWRFVETADEVTEIKAVTEKKIPEKTTKPRPVLCVETGKIFPSIIAAGRHHNISHKCIARACKRSEFTSCGFHWRYVDSPQA